MTDTVAEPAPTPAGKEVAAPVGGDARGGLDTPVPPVLAAAVVAAWAEFDAVKKSKTAVVEHRGGGSHSYSYADLADVLEMARPILARHGLALLQPVTRRVGHPLEIETWLLHTSGHMLRWVFETAAGESAQATGGAITYARRYCGGAALGIATDEDVDGRDDGAPDPPAGVTPPRHTRKVAAPKKAAARVPSNQSPAMRAMFAVFRGLHVEDREAQHRVAADILGHPVDTFTTLGDAELQQVVDGLKVRQRAAADADDEVDGRSARWDDEGRDRDGSGY